MLYLDIPDSTQIVRLAETRSDAAVSIYLSTTPLTQDIEQARISLKNHAKTALAQLEAAGIDKRRLWPIETELEDLVEDDAFWAHQAHSLAIFVTPERLRRFRLPTRLEDSVHVSDRFHLKPLLRATSFGHDAYVLDIAEGGVRLIDVPASGAATEIRVQNLPKDAADALGKSTLNDRAPSRRIQGDEGKNLRLRQYVKIVDQAVRAAIAGSDRPLVIAGADPLRSFYRQESDYPRLAEASIEGNVQHLSPAELAERVRPVLDDLHAAEMSRLRDLYEQRGESGRATADVAQVARAASAGAVDTLMIDMDAVLPGTLDEDGALSLAQDESATSYGVTDAIAARVMAAGGRIVALRNGDLPDSESPVAAILRYPI